MDTDKIHKDKMKDSCDKTPDEIIWITKSGTKRGTKHFAAKSERATSTRPGTRAPRLPAWIPVSGGWAQTRCNFSSRREN